MAVRSGGAGHVVAIADARDHRITILQLDRVAAVTAVLGIWGSGLRGACYGPVSCLVLNEPVGLAFDGAVLLVACYGGEKHGALVSITPTRFACRVLTHLHACFAACGLVPPNATAEARKARHLSSESSIAKLDAAATFLNRQVSERSRMLSQLGGLAGPDGSFYGVSMRMLTASVRNTRHLHIDLDASGLTNAANVTVHALLDEGKVESSFGQWVMASSMDNPDVKEVAMRMPAIMRHTLNRHGRPPFDQHESRNPFYQPSQRSSMDTGELWRKIRRSHSKHYPPKPARRHSVVRLATEWGNARRVISLARHQRTGSVRSSFYKRKPGTGPDVLAEGGTAEPVAEGMTTTQIRTTFRLALEQWRSRRRAGAPSSQQQLEVAQQSREYHLFVAGWRCDFRCSRRARETTRRCG